MAEEVRTKISVVRKFLRLTPSPNIIGGWRGRLELALLALISLVGCLPTCIAAAVSLRSIHEMVSMGLTNSSSELVSVSCGMSGLVICLALITIVTMAVHAWILFEYVNDDKFLCGILFVVKIIEVIMMIGFLIPGSIAIKYSNILFDESNIAKFPLICCLMFSLLTAILLFLSDAIWNAVLQPVYCIRRSKPNHRYNSLS